MIEQGVEGCGGERLRGIHKGGRKFTGSGRARPVRGKPVLASNIERKKTVQPFR